MNNIINDKGLKEPSTSNGVQLNRNLIYLANRSEVHPNVSVNFYLSLVEMKIYKRRQEVNIFILSLARYYIIEYTAKRALALSTKM